MCATSRTKDHHPPGGFRCGGSASRDGDAPALHVQSAHFTEFTGSAARYLQRTPRIINTTAEGEEWGLMGEITVE